MLSAQSDPFLANILHRAILCVENQPAVTKSEKEVFLHTSDADRKLEKAIIDLRQNYEIAKYSDHVCSKIGWALFQTWKKYE